MKIFKRFLERHIIIFFIKNAKLNSRWFYLMNYVIWCQKDLQNINSIKSKYLVSWFNFCDNIFAWYVQKFPASFLHNIRKFFKFALLLLLCTNRSVTIHHLQVQGEISESHKTSSTRIFRKLKSVYGKFVFLIFLNVAYIIIEWDHHWQWKLNIKPENNDNYISS